MPIAKPIPVPNEDSAPFWDAAKRGEFRLQQCDDCGAVRFPPAVMCPECNSLAAQWKPVSGRGKVYSYVVFHRAYHPAFKEDLPYAVACIELEEGPRLLANVVGIPPDQVRCEMAVEMFLQDAAEGMRIPQFRPVGAQR
jgi:uncharacterized OB-fold protein